MLPPALLARFARDLEALTGAPAPRLGLAVSGGPDSLALLRLAAHACSGRVEAATVDHGLRPESSAEAAHVARVCADLGVPHQTLPVQVVPVGEGLQAAARAARYGALEAWAAARALPALLIRRTQVRLRGLGFRERHEREIAAEALVRIDTCWAVSTGLGLVDYVIGSYFQTRGLLLALDAGELKRLDEVSTLPSEYPGWMFARQGEVRRKQLADARRAGPAA